MTAGDNKELEEKLRPYFEKDYHGHPSYERVISYLLGLMALSILAGLAFERLHWLLILAAFSVAIFKALLVIRNFMHIRYEPVFIVLLVLIFLFCAFAFFFGVFPDIPVVPLEMQPPLK